MKYSTLLAIFVLLSVSAVAQRIRFSDNTNQWKVYHYDCRANGTPNIVYNYYYAYDSTIAGLLYRKMGNGPWFIREDTVSNKVYLREPHYNGDSTEHLLYDYTLNVGDTFRASSAPFGSEWHVSARDSVQINAQWYKTWNFILDSGNTIGAEDFFVIEGIGCLNDPVWPVFTNIGEYCMELTCFHNHGSIPLVSPMAGGYFDNATSCSLILDEGVKNTAEGSGSLSVFPIPVVTKLSITSKTHITSFTITNLLGQTLLNHNCNSEQMEVDVADLPPGVYLVKINGTDVRKFVKQ